MAFFCWTFLNRDTGLGDLHRPLPTLTFCDSVILPCTSIFWLASPEALLLETDIKWLPYFPHISSSLWRMASRGNGVCSVTPTKLITYCGQLTPCQDRGPADTELLHMSGSTFQVRSLSSSELRSPHRQNTGQMSMKEQLQVLVMVSRKGCFSRMIINQRAVCVCTKKPLMNQTKGDKCVKRGQREIRGRGGVIERRERYEGEQVWYTGELRWDYFSDRRFCSIFVCLWLQSQKLTQKLLSDFLSLQLAGFSICNLLVQRPFKPWFETCLFNKPIK